MVKYLEFGKRLKKVWSLVIKILDQFEYSWIKYNDASNQYKAIGYWLKGLSFGNNPNSIQLTKKCKVERQWFAALGKL